ncbi:hypothetical protein H8356DRAFT_1416707 [Neocallimastix lanati (nom. inval.)]|nr:hypothetical protein H8356DRAFT_1416707 [Neocallimastix sp. JGI-2020a]
MCCKMAYKYNHSTIFKVMQNLASFCKNTSKHYHLYIIITVLNLPNLDIYQQYGFYSKYMQKCYDFKPRKHTKNPLRNAAHGDKQENRAWNAVELRRFVEISRE